MTGQCQRPVLLGVDVHSIQRYLFATSKLREVIGASRIVDDFTGPEETDVPLRTLTRMRLAPCTTGLPTGSAWFVPVRLGGGSLRLLLPNEESARQFVRHMSEWALANARDLTFDAAWVPFDLKAGNLADANSQLISLINERRREDHVGNEFNGFPFCAPCRLTGAPAEGYGGRNERLCGASLAKRAYQAQHDDRWARVADEPLLQVFKVRDVRRPFILDLESMTGEERADSYMAVVAVDLNSLGDRGKHEVGGALGVEALHLLHRFVQRVSGATAEAFSSALSSLGSNAASSHEFLVLERITASTGTLPIRPLVFGGDDLTFVVHSALAPRFALSLASALESAGFPCGVGLAIVKTKSPLSRAIGLAEGLLARAKRAGRDRSHVDLMLCSSEIPKDVSEREVLGTRPARGPYALDSFGSLLHHAELLKNDLPSGQVRTAADGFHASLGRGRDSIRELIENIDRGLGGGRRASREARILLQQMLEDDLLASSFLDCVDLFRFLPSPEKNAQHRSGNPVSEVNS